MSGFIPPAELFKSLVDIGEKKASQDAVRLLLLGILAGAYIGFAAHLATTVATGSFEWYGAKKFLVGAVFSFGLMLVIIPGSELWTGNNLMSVSLLEKRITFSSMLRNWFFVYFGNLIGSVMLAFLIVKSSGLLDGAVGGTAIKIAMGKIVNTPEGLDHNYAYFFRAIGCNWLVCLAVMMALAAKDIAGKILGIFFPIMAFVASGFEHSIANMYFISAGIFAKDFTGAVAASGISPDFLSVLNWSEMWFSNIIAVTLGNFVGGTLFVAIFYWYIYVKTPSGGRG
jgi:formate/nitrite transporter